MEADKISIEMLTAAKASAMWAFWSMIGTWFAGLATFCAVLTSLYLALKKPKSHLTGKVTVKRVYDHVYEGHAVIFSVVNLSLHPVVLSRIEWSFGKKQRIIQMMREGGTNQLPVKIEHGEVVKYRILLDEGKEQFANRFASRLANEISRVDKLKCWAVLSIGQKYQIIVDKRIKDMLVDSISKNRIDDGSS